MISGMNWSCCCLCDPDQAIDRSSDQIDSLLSEIGRDDSAFSRLGLDTPLTVSLRQWFVEDSADGGTLRPQQRSHELLLMANKQISVLNDEILAKGQKGRHGLCARSRRLWQAAAGT